MNFASDNTGGVHPRIMQAIAAANAGHLPSYGADGITKAAQDALRRVFDAPKAAVHFVATGTAANALALSLLTPPWGRVFCHQSAHIQTSESGAPEFYSAGAKLVPVAGGDGRIDPDALAARLREFGRSSVHAGQNAAISLTNATEWGTVYDPDQVAALSDAAYHGGMAVHMDGARFANALAAQGGGPADLSWRAGVDVLTLGGTKNGCMGVEAVMIFDPVRAEEFEYRRKRGGHLLSKHRFLSAQVLAWLEDGLWLQMAGHANRMAAILGQGMQALPAVHLLAPVQTNSVFATLPRRMVNAARAAGAQFHLWPGDHIDDGHGPVSVRLVCAWDTQPQDVQALLDTLAQGAGDQVKGM